MAFMNHKKAERWMSRAMDGELSPRRAARLDAYLKAHPHVAEQRDAWKQSGDLLRAHCAETPAQTPEAAWNDVRRAIRVASSDVREKQALNGRMVWASSLAALLLLVAGTWFTLRYIADQGFEAVAEAHRTEVEFVETDLPDAMSMVYEDAETGLTVIWVLVTEEQGHAGS